MKSYCQVSTVSCPIEIALNWRAQEIASEIIKKVSVQQKQKQRRPDQHLSAMPCSLNCKVSEPHTLLATNNCQLKTNRQLNVRIQDFCFDLNLYLRNFSTKKDVAGSEL